MLVTILLATQYGHVLVHTNRSPNQNAWIAFCIMHRTFRCAIHGLLVLAYEAPPFSILPRSPHWKQ